MERQAGRRQMAPKARGVEDKYAQNLSAGRGGRRDWQYGTGGDPPHTVRTGYTTRKKVIHVLLFLLGLMLGGLVGITTMCLMQAGRQR